MRKLVLFLLAGVLVSGAARCNGGGGGPDPVGRTVAAIHLDGESCAGKFDAAVARITAVESRWTSGKFPLHPGEEVKVSLPRGGSHRVFIKSRAGYWDYTVLFAHGEETRAVYDCN